MYGTTRQERPGEEFFTGSRARAIDRDLLALGDKMRNSRMLIDIRKDYDGGEFNKAAETAVELLKAQPTERQSLLRAEDVSYLIGIVSERRAYRREVVRVNKAMNMGRYEEAKKMTDRLLDSDKARDYLTLKQVGYLDEVDDTVILEFITEARLDAIRKRQKEKRQAKEARKARKYERKILAGEGLLEQALSQGNIYEAIGLANRLTARGYNGNGRFSDIVDVLGKGKPQGNGSEVAPRRTRRVAGRFQQPTSGLRI